jgi:inorganic pyrophosphatase
MSAFSAIAALPAFLPGSRDVHAIVDTPGGSRNKFKFDETRGLFMLGGAMPAGAVFPFEFGFIPSTRGGDGDPLDLLILLDAPTFVGCLIEARLLGVIEAEQTESGKTERNDRLIAVAIHSRRHEDLKNLGDLSKTHLAEIEHFFVSYNAIKGKTFKPLGRHGPRDAVKLVRQSARAVERPGAWEKPSGASKSTSRGAFPPLCPIPREL